MRSWKVMLKAMSRKNLWRLKRQTVPILHNSQIPGRATLRSSKNPRLNSILRRKMRKMTLLPAEGEPQDLQTRRKRRRLQSLTPRNLRHAETCGPRTDDLVAALNVEAKKRAVTSSLPRKMVGMRMSQVQESLTVRHAKEANESKRMTAATIGDRDLGEGRRRRLTLK